MGSARAATIEVVPTSQGVRVGGSVDVEIRISGLGHHAAPSLSSYDLDVGFDPTVLELTGVTLDQGVNDQLDLHDTGHRFADSMLVKGSVNLFEMSRNSQADLETLQAGRFTLAELTFVALAEGESALTLTANAVEDAGGLPMKYELSDGAVKVGLVPEPASTILFLLGAGIVGVAIRRRLGSAQ
jgi:hypothetical protein